MSPVASAMPASPNRRPMRIMAARRSVAGRRGNDIPVADEMCAARLDAAPYFRADECSELVAVPVLRHRAHERRRATGRRMEVQLADAVRQPVDEAQYPFLGHGSAPGEAE